ncbi:DUF6785 family protein [Candidatus Poribacteria bacterium]
MRNGPAERSLGQSRAITWRVIVIGFILAPLNSYWVARALMVWSASPTYISMFYNVIFCVTALTLLNLAVKGISRRYALSQSELLTVYAILGVSSAVAGQDQIGMLIPKLGHPFWFATPENGWQDLFLRHIPSWLSVGDKKVLMGYYKGESSIYIASNVRAWIVPVLSWSAFIFVSLMIMFCINIIVRRRWSEEEKLSYPITQLPLEMTRFGGSSDFFRNRLLWLGFGIAGAINMLNSLSFFYPALPSIPVRSFDLGRYLIEKPWDAIGMMPIHFNPFVVGFGYFMPLDLSFSYWVFYLVWKAENVVGSVLGVRSMFWFPYVREQKSGAVFALTIILIWTSRRHLAQVFRSALEKKKTSGAEPITYRIALLIIGSGFLFLTLFCLRAGMSLWVILPYLVIYYALSTIITRMRSQLGPPMNELNRIGPTHVMEWTFGTRKLGAGNLTVISYLWFLNRSHTCHPMPYQMESIRVADRSGFYSRRFVVVMVAAFATGIIGAFWSYLHIFYKEGAESGMSFFALYSGKNAFGDHLQPWLAYPSNTDGISLSFMGVGAGFTFALMFLKTRFLWWSLHPIAYPLAGDYRMNSMWFGIFLSWLAKSIILKYGGLKSYRKAIPFFIGLILGEFMIGGGWSIVSVVFDVPVYRFWT